MNSTRINSAFLFLLVVSVFQGLVTSTIAQAPAPTQNTKEFRIDTDRYEDESRPPVISTKVYFQSDRAIEWDEKQNRATLIDYRNSKIIVADLNNRRATQIDMSQLATNHEAAVSQLSPEQRARAMSSAPPAQGNDGYYVLQSKSERYRFRTTKPKSISISKEYAAFADWAARVNCHYPPFKPGFLRMQLDEFAANASLLPTEIRWTGYTTSGPSPELVAVIECKESLDQEDRKNIERLSNEFQVCKQISPEQFFR